jgi:hypothetical protein
MTSTQGLLARALRACLQFKEPSAWGTKAVSRSSIFSGRPEKFKALRPENAQASSNF